MRISDWSSDVCSSDLVSRIPCREDSPMAKLSLMLLAAPLATAGFSLPAAANPAAEDGIERHTAIVRYNDLNLSSVEGRERLTTRVKPAVRQVCRSRPPHRPSLPARCATTRCANTPLADAHTPPPHHNNST